MPVLTRGPYWHVNENERWTIPASSLREDPSSSVWSGSPGLPGAPRLCPSTRSGLRSWHLRMSRGSSKSLAFSKISLFSPQGDPRDGPPPFCSRAEGLEVRTMLSTTGSGFLGSGSNTTQNLPITFPQKELRIQKMPTNLRALQPNRFLPPETINQIQLGLNEIMSQIEPAPPRGADQLQPGDAQYRSQHLP